MWIWLQLSWNINLVPLASGLFRCTQVMQAHLFSLARLSCSCVLLFSQSLILYILLPIYHENYPISSHYSILIFFFLSSILTIPLTLAQPYSINILFFWGWHQTCLQLLLFSLIEIGTVCPNVVSTSPWTAAIREAYCSKALILATPYLINKSESKSF